MAAARSLPDRSLAVLVVDDSAVSRYVLSSLVESLGHRCAVAPDAEAGLALMRARRTDVVLMDATMPGLDGLAATRAARALPEPQRPRAIIGVSATRGERAAAAFRAAGAEIVLAKPIAVAALAAALATV